MTDSKDITSDVDVKMEITTILSKSLDELVKDDSGIHSVCVNVIYNQFLKSPDGKLTEMKPPLIQSLVALTHGIISVLRSVIEEPVNGQSSATSDADLYSLSVAFCNMLMEQVEEMIGDPAIKDAEIFDGFDLPQEMRDKMEQTAHLWRGKKGGPKA